MTIELQKKRRRVVPLLAALEHFSGLIQQSRPFERLARQPAVFGELRVIRGRACDGEATEALFQEPAVVLSSPAVVSGLSAHLRGFQVMSDALENRSGFGQRARLDEYTRGFVILSFTLIDPRGVAVAPVLFEDFGRTLPVAGGQGGVGPRLALFVLLAHAENLFPAGTALGGPHEHEQNEHAGRLEDLDRQNELAQNGPGLGAKQGDGSPNLVRQSTSIIQTAREMKKQGLSRSRRRPRRRHRRGCNKGRKPH